MVRASARAKVADFTASHHPGDGVELQRLEEVPLTTTTSIYQIPNTEHTAYRLGTDFRVQARGRNQRDLDGHTQRNRRLWHALTAAP